MKRTTKKTLFVFVLIAAMMLSIFPAAAFAEGAAAVEPAAQTEQQPEKDAAPAAKDDGAKPAEPAKGDGAKPAEPVKDGENKAEPVKNDEKSVVVEGKDGEKPADPALNDGDEKGEPEVKNDGEEPVKEEENTGAAPKTPEEENGDEKAEEEKGVPAVSDAVRAFLAAASAFTMPEDVMELTDEECMTLAAQIKDLFVMYSQLSEEDLALPEVQAAAAALKAAYAALDARNTAEVLLSATRANSSVPLTLTVSSYSAPFINGGTGEHTVGSHKESKYIKYIKRSDVGSDNSSGSATARFVGSNEAGWTLVIDDEVGNYKETWTTNAKITNKDMSAATGSVTFGLSFNTAGGTSTYIHISGGKDLPKPSPSPSPSPSPTPTPTPIPSPSPTPTPTPIPSSTPTPTPSTSPSPAPVVKATLNYDGNGGTGAPDSESKSGPQGSSATFTVSSITPTRENYTFKGWNTKADGSGTAYEAGKTISVAYGSTTTLYAQWELELTQMEVPVTLQVIFNGIDSLPTDFAYSVTGADGNVALKGTLTKAGEALVGTSHAYYYVTDAPVTLDVDKDYTFNFTQSGYQIDGYTWSGNVTETLTGKVLPENKENGLILTIVNNYTKEEVTPVDWGKLGISKSVSPTGPVKPGTTLTYTITVTNNTGADLDSVVVYDALDRHLTFVSATGAGSYSTRTWFWTVAPLANGDSATLVIQATVNAGTADKTVIYNTASVLAASAGNEDLKVGSGPSASANVAVTNPGSGTWGGTTWGKGVQTGDDANLGLWIAAMIVSFLCVAALVYVNRKRIFKGKANNK